MKAEVALDRFQEAMSRVPCPVAVVTAMDGNRPHGTTVSAFCSLSADPPMVLVSLDKKSNLLEIIRRTGRFGINILALDQEPTAMACAQKGIDKFSNIDWEERNEVPHILGTSAWFACDLQDEQGGGDHVVLHGMCFDLDEWNVKSLYYYRRRFFSPGSQPAAGVGGNAIGRAIYQQPLDPVVSDRTRTS